jgi:hypothetical protein
VVDRPLPAVGADEVGHELNVYQLRGAASAASG